MCFLSGYGSYRQHKPTDRWSLEHWDINLTNFFQVMDHTDNLNQLNDDFTNIQTDTEEIEDRTTAAETNIILLESEIEVLDIRASDIEQILFGKKYQSAQVRSS